MLASQVTDKKNNPLIRPTPRRLKRLKSALIREGRKRICQEWFAFIENNQAVGHFTRRLDGALPRNHTWNLYNSLSSQEAGILRTDHNHLKKYLYQRKLSESDMCECGQNEDTSRNLILECQRREGERQVLRPKIGDRWGDLSYMLGGWNSWKDRRSNTLDGAKEKWKPVIPIVIAVV